MELIHWFCTAIVMFEVSIILFLFFMAWKYSGDGYHR